MTDHPRRRSRSPDIIGKGKGLRARSRPMVQVLGHGLRILNVEAPAFRKNGPETKCLVCVHVGLLEA